VATEAAWLNGNNLEKEEIKKRKKQKNGRKVLTLTGLLMEGLKNRLAEEWSDCNLELLCQRRCTPRIRLYSTETLAYGPPHGDP
jgi:hypothetical protein